MDLANQGFTPIVPEKERAEEIVEVTPRSRRCNDQLYTKLRFFRKVRGRCRGTVSVFHSVPPIRREGSQEWRSVVVEIDTEECRRRKDGDLNGVEQGVLIKRVGSFRGLLP